MLLKEIEKFKNLLEAALEDVHKIQDLITYDGDGCLIADRYDGCPDDCPLNIDDEDYCGWKRQVDVLVLLQQTKTIKNGRNNNEGDFI